MGLRTLAIKTGSGLRTLAIAAKENTEGALNPKVGDRKVRMTLILVLPFLLLVAFLMFYYRESLVDMLKIMQNTITYVLGIFTGGNGLEHLANSIGNNKSGGGNGDGNGGSGETFTP